MTPNSQYTLPLLFFLLKYYQRVLLLLHHLPHLFFQSEFKGSPSPTSYAVVFFLQIAENKSSFWEVFKKNEQD